MAIKDQKIYASDYSGKDVSGLPDSVVGQADWLKERFDALTKEVVVPRFNAVIDELSSEQGGDNIGAGWKHKTLGEAVLAQDVRELRVDANNRLELAVEKDYWVTPPAGHTLLDAYGQQRRETPKMQFLNADVSVVGDTTVVRPLSNGDGLPGRDGLSAYDEALLGGYHGTQENFDGLLAGLDETTACAVGAAHPNYLRNADFEVPFNTKGLASYEGEQGETIDHWKLHSAGEFATLGVQTDGVLFTCSNFADEFCQELSGLSHLAGQWMTLSVFGMPQSLTTGFNATIQIRYVGGSTITRSSGLVGVGAGDEGALAQANMLVPADMTDEDVLAVYVWGQNEGDSVLLKWAKLELGESGTRPLPRDPTLERFVSGPDIGYKVGLLIGNASTVGTVRVVDCGFTPSAVLMVVGGEHWYKGTGSTTPYYRTSGYIGLATREYPHSSSELLDAIKIVEGGFSLTLSTWSEFNREGYHTNYIAFR